MTAEAREVSIRNAREGDSRAIARYISMAESEMVRHFTGVTDPEAALDALEEFVLSPVRNRYSLDNDTVVEVDGRTVGAMMTFPADEQPDLDGPLLESMNSRGHGLDELFFEGEEGTYYLSTLGVDPAYRGMGLGGRLLEAFEERAKKLGFGRVSLLVSKKKARVRELYEYIGYVVADEVRIGGNEYYRMHKNV